MIYMIGVIEMRLFSEIKQKTPEKKTLRYPGDIKDGISPKSALKGIRLCKKVIIRQRKQIKVLRAKHRRHIKRITSLKALLKELKNKFSLSEHANESIQVSSFYFIVLSNKFKALNKLL